VKISAKNNRVLQKFTNCFFFFSANFYKNFNPEISPNVYKTMEKSATSELGALQSAQIV
jgi:hypothetical protein